MNPDNLAADPRLRSAMISHPYPLLFATVSGAHLYGFPSADSDFDLRGVHLLPLNKMLGLEVTDETLTHEQIIDGMEVDLVTHDARKFFRLVLKKNGYVLEQIFSPLVVHSLQPQFDNLRDIARRCITRHHAHHYKGFAHNQWKLFDRERPRRVKPLLYVYRVLLTGIHLMNTGEVEANLVTLNDAEFHLHHVDQLVARKRAGFEQGTLKDNDVLFHEGEFHRLLVELEAAAERSPLPELPAGRDDLNALLLSLRAGTVETAAKRT
jgi:predicted nucleotidyltransferase